MTTDPTPANQPRNRARTVAVLALGVLAVASLATASASPLYRRGDWHATYRLRHPRTTSTTAAAAAVVTTTAPPATAPPTTAAPAPTLPPTTAAPTPTTQPPTTAPQAPTTGINSLDRVLYSMAGPHEGALHGVPTYWSWAQQPTIGSPVPPSGMGALTAWGQIYADSSNAHPANVRVELRNMETYVYSNSQHVWQRMQGSNGVEGAHYMEDFSGNSSIPTNLRAESDGGVSTDMTSGYNFHFWPTGGRAGLSNPSDIGAVYTTVQARLVLDDPAGPDNRDQARYLANVGGDWWRDPTIGFGDGSNNPGIGQGRFMYLSSSWSAIDFYTGGPVASATGSWTASQMSASNPPLNARG